MLTESAKISVNINDNCFDIIRIIVAYIVFFGHFLTHFQVDSPVLFDIAYFVRGVPVFFLLSGFFIAASLERYGSKEFLLRRIFRIYPAMWVCILLNTALIFLVYDIPTLNELLVYFSTQLTVFQFYTGDWLRGYGVGVPNGALWMISCMIQFYILAIFFAKFLKHRSLKVWLITVVIFILPNFFLAPLEGILPDIIWSMITVIVFPFLYIFLLGMMFYYHRERFVPFLKKYWYIFCVVYVLWELFAPVSVLSLFEGVRYNVITTLLLSFVTIALGFAFGSYRFYLYHMVILNLIYHLFVQQFDTVSLFVAVLVASTVVIAFCAYVSYVYAERKLGDMLQKKALIK